MKNFEQIHSGNSLRRTAVVFLLGISSLAITSCSGSGEPEKQIPAKTDSVEQPGIQYTYLDDGSRFTEYPDPNEHTPIYAPILSFCDGLDLVDQTAYSETYHGGAAGNSIERSVGHPACNDGRLTPDDFKIPG